MTDLSTFTPSGIFQRIDLNADVGEWYGRWTLGDDEALMQVITNANVACGFHAGDPSTIRRTCEAVARSDVSIGAQVAYPDLVGFGRRRMNRCGTRRDSRQCFSTLARASGS